MTRRMTESMTPTRITQPNVLASRRQAHKKLVTKEASR
jgi:hypothetical protein